MPISETIHRLIEEYQSGAETLDEGCGEAVASNPISAKSKHDQKLKLIRLFRILRSPLFWLFLKIVTALKRTYDFISEKGKIISCALQPLHSVDARPLCCEFKEGEQIAVTRTLFWLFGYAHHGVVVGYKTIEGRILTMVAHWQRPSSQSDQSTNNYKCECGYTGPPKDGGYAKSCLNCFKRCGFVFKIQHIGRHLLSPERIENLKPGEVYYHGYCNDNIYLAYFLDGICQGYTRVKKNDHGKKPVDNRTRFVETSKRSKEEILKAALDESTNSKPYNIVWNNCEHAAMLIMTGMRRSFQLETCPKRIVWKIWIVLCYCFRAKDVSNIVEIGGPSEPIPEENKEKNIEKEIAPPSEHIQKENEEEADMVMKEYIYRGFLWCINQYIKLGCCTMVILLILIEFWFNKVKRVNPSIEAFLNTVIHWGVNLCNFFMYIA